jgi:hypothetical protein
MGDEEAVKAIRVEIEQIRDEAAQSSRSAHFKARFWSRLDLVLGFPAAMLAVASGATGLATVHARVIAASLALASAAITAGRGFLRADVRRRADRNSRYAWAELEGEARLLLTQTNLTADEMLTRLAVLFQHRIAAMSAYDRQRSERGQGNNL